VANVVVVLVVVLVAWSVVSVIRRHRRGLVAERGTSIGADLGALSDQPCVRVKAVTDAGPGHVLLILTPEPGPDDGLDVSTPADLEVLVNLREEEFGFGLLQGWKQSHTLLAIVMPPDSRILRLRAVEDLQPLTLSRVHKT
jgi:hypothetical protein